MITEAQREYGKKWRQNNKEKMASYSRKWHQENKKHCYETTKKWRDNNPVKHKAIQRKAVLKRLYDLSVEEFALLEEKQEHKCAICKQEKKLYVDHSHSTGLVRGLLCRKCNLGLGHFNDMLETVLAAAAYLKEQESV